jgi:hypothetical protein
MNEDDNKNDGKGLTPIKQIITAGNHFSYTL